MTRSALLALPLCLAGTAAAQDREESGVWSFVAENDAIAGTDSNYTNGLRLSYTTSAGGGPDWLFGWARDSWLFPDGAEYRAEFALGQSIFTSSDIDDPNPPPGDRPYAGWLYGETGLVGDNGRRLHSLKVSLGVVGPAALGEEVQSTWHDIFGYDEPQGWDTQLENEPALLVAYERRWRLSRRDLGPLDIEFMPTLGATVGNVYTYANVGANVRVGRNVPRDYGVATVQPGSPGAGWFEADRFGWYVFGGVEGRAVAHNIFLDGNTWEDSRSVDKETFVGDAQVGAAIVWPRARLSYTYVFRTDEFETQREPEDFGRLSLSFRF